MPYLTNHINNYPPGLSGDECYVLIILDDSDDHFAIEAERIAEGILMVESWCASRSCFARLYVLSGGAALSDIRAHHAERLEIDRAKWAAEKLLAPGADPRAGFPTLVGAVRIEPCTDPSADRPVLVPIIGDLHDPESYIAL